MVSCIRALKVRLVCASFGVAIVGSSPAMAQHHMGHDMVMTGSPAAAAPADPAQPSARQPASAPVTSAPSASAMDMSQPPVDHAVMDHSAMGHDMATSRTFAEGSGTARLPGNEPMNHGLHLGVGGADTLMLHGYVWGVYTKQSSPRGGEKLYAQSMAMAQYEHPFEGGRLQLRAMGSLEPAMSHDGYPNLFATGEVAYGRPLVDRQHPHDLFMELAGRLDIDIADGTSVFVYGGPVGEPALGPSAFMHRGSAKYNPEAPITHHWFDSTHITYGVVTTGVSAPKWQLEGSAFRGREPDEFRWNIEAPKLDSWSVRATFTPTPAWAIQASYGHLKSPEEQHPNENEDRTTFSASYDNGHGLSATAAFSSKRRVPGRALTAWLGEANWNIDAHHTVFGRVENVANDELFPDPAHPLHDETFRITKLQVGYAYRLALPDSPVRLALGGTISAFAKPAALNPYYGNNPLGFALFAKLSLGD
jgi:hypothetical protein